MKKSELIRRTIGLFLLGFLISLGFLQPVREIFDFPRQWTLFKNEPSELSSRMSSFMKIAPIDPHALEVSGDAQHVQLTGKKTGSSKMMVSIGNMPVKEVAVDVLPVIRLVPGGESIGVKLNSIGVLVVGYHLVAGQNGERSPGEDAGIKVGDIITSINGQKVEDMSDVKALVNDAGADGQPLHVSIVRNDQTLRKTLKPVKDKKDNKYRIGLYIRDSAAGIGTMTFYDPKSRKYGALGHVISDVDTKQPIQVHDGEIVRSSVTAIDKGSNGHPGEKIATFPADERPIGSVKKNTPFGIFGSLNRNIRNDIADRALPIALSNEVKEGPAKILTVLNGNRVEAFDIKIMSSVPQKYPATKGLVIKITDPRLLRATGGIVQGMSGSPIIQDGKLIGAVTHVFVNDPTSGYGVHIEWMLKEAGIDIYQHHREKKAS